MAVRTQATTDEPTDDYNDVREGDFVRLDATSGPATAVYGNVTRVSRFEKSGDVKAIALDSPVYGELVAHTIGVVRDPNTGRLLGRHEGEVLRLHPTTTQ